MIPADKRPDRLLGDAAAHRHDGGTATESIAVGARDRGALWFELMAEGRFEDAWILSDAALLDPDVGDFTKPRHEQRIWRGTPLAGQRVLVRCYHGLGDTIQFIRYVPLLKRVARSVDVWAQPPLLPVLASMPGIDALLPLHDGAVERDFDVDVEVMELPHVFRSTPDTLPATVPYLLPAGAGRAATRSSPRLQIGVTWRAGEWDARRSVPFAALCEVLEGTRADVTPIQDTLTRAEAAVFPQWTARPLLDVAACVATLDLVITVDTMTAHLAGALGVPTWLLLHSAPDWRWMRDRIDSPWYPTMRLFRQQRAGDWVSPLHQVKRELTTLMRSFHRS